MLLPHVSLEHCYFFLITHIISWAQFSPTQVLGKGTDPWPLLPARPFKVIVRRRFIDGRLNYSFKIDTSSLCHYQKNINLVTHRSLLFDCALERAPRCVLPALRKLRESLEAGFYGSYYYRNFANGIKIGNRSNTLLIDDKP